MALDFGIDLVDGRPEMTLEKRDSIYTNIWLSLNIRRGTLFVDLSFGSRLHEIDLLTDDNVRLARDYCREALKWMLDTGRLKRLDVSTERDASDRNRLNIAIGAITQDDRIVEYETYYSVV